MGVCRCRGGMRGQRTQPVKPWPIRAAASCGGGHRRWRAPRRPARTSQALTDSRSRLAACSMPALSCSGSRRLIRAVRGIVGLRRRPRLGCRLDRVFVGRGGAATTKSGSPRARSRSSTDPGASSRVCRPPPPTAPRAASAGQRTRAARSGARRAPGRPHRPPPRRRPTRLGASRRSASGPWCHSGTTMASRQGLNDTMRSGMGFRPPCR